MKETTQGAASSRPWRIKVSDELSVKDAGGKHICQTEYDCAFNRNFELNAANAQLIVTAVNQFSGLTAIAESHSNLLKMIDFMGLNKSMVFEDKVNRTLAKARELESQLATIQKENK